jgi:hypothetical protein
MKLTEAKLKQMILESMMQRYSLSDDIPNDMKGKSSAWFSMKKDDKIKTRIERGRALKQSYAKHADETYLSQLTTYHYIPTKKLEEFFQTVTSKDELSCVAYDETEGESITFNPPLGQKKNYVAFGVNGRITLLANRMDDLNTGSGSEYTDVFPERTKNSGANKGVSHIPDEATLLSHNIYVFDEDDWDPHEEIGRRMNEALVDNWNIWGILVDTAEKKSYVESLMASGKIPQFKVFIV